ALTHRARHPLVPHQVGANGVVGAVEGRTCILVDVIIDPAGTITKAADALFAAGAADVVVAATHAMLSDPATERLKNCRVSELVLTNTLPIPQDKMLDKYTVLSIAPLIALAIREVFEDGSVTSLFDGNAS